MREESCVYCQEFKRGYFAWEGKNYGSRIIHETENFVVFPSLGPLKEGHILIAPREHRFGMSAVPEEHYKELEAILKEMQEKLSQVYGTSILFEHGDINREKKAGSCIQHGHFHAIPADIELILYLKRHFTGREVSDLVELREQTRKHEPYLFVEEKGKKYIFPVANILPSQYLRQAVAVLLKRSERWNWRNILNIEEMIHTKEKVSRW